MNDRSTNNKESESGITPEQLLLLNKLHEETKRIIRAMERIFTRGLSLNIRLSPGHIENPRHLKTDSSDK